MYSPAAVRRHASKLTASFDPVFLAHPLQRATGLVECRRRHPHSLPQDVDAVLTPWSSPSPTLSTTGASATIRQVLVPVTGGWRRGRPLVSQPPRFAVPEPGATASARSRCGSHACRSCRASAHPCIPEPSRRRLSTPIDTSATPATWRSCGPRPLLRRGRALRPPPAQPRAHDLRHAAPQHAAHHRILVTEAARRRLDGGATTPADHARRHRPPTIKRTASCWRLAGVSLSFSD